MATVGIKKVFKSYKGLEVVHGVDLDVQDSEFVVLLGPSGCGKSTMLRMIAGLEEISDGEISIGDRVVNDVAPKDRKIAMVFQNYALYPHMTVEKNMSFGLKLQKMPKEEIKKQVAKAAEILGLEKLLDRKPAALSGGQRQRVAMGRAMVRTPSVFLFDEPLSNLDAKLRTQMRMEIQKLHKQLKTTTIYVTHDQIEAMTLADRIVIMRDGYIEQVGTPKDIFEHPNNVFVATFVGSPAMNMIKMKTKGVNGEIVVESNSLSFPLPAKEGHRVKPDMDVILGIRPTDLYIAHPTDGFPDELKFEGIIDVPELLGADALVNMNVGEHEIVAMVNGKDMPKSDEKIKMAIDANAVQIFDATSEKSIY